MKYVQTHDIGTKQLKFNLKISDEEAISLGEEVNRVFILSGIDWSKGKETVVTLTPGNGFMVIIDGAEATHGKRHEDSRE